MIVFFESFIDWLPGKVTHKHDKNNLLAKLIVHLSACWGFNPDRDLTLDVMILALIEWGTSAILISNATEVCKSFQRDFSRGRAQLYQSLKSSNMMIEY